MEGVSDQLPDHPAPEKLRFDAANDFLTICDGTAAADGRPPGVCLPQRRTVGYDSGYYWEDVQRALRIAAGLEKWRQRPTA